MTPAVRFTWNMLYDCNYRCAYCFFEGKWEEYQKRNTYLAVDKLVAHWSRAREKYGPINLIITGGEPFIYPNFIEIIKRLSEICFHINISSNSSGDLNSFVEEISPKNVSLSLSYHPQFDDLETFIKRLLFIRKHQFSGCINLVAYPAFINKIKGYQDKFAAISEPLKTIPFFGEYRGKIYPQSYTTGEQEVIGIDASWFKKVKRQGLMCQAGQKTALVFPDGKVARCGQVGDEFILGNFFDPQFNLSDKKLPCPAEFCPCGEDEIIFNEEDNTKVKDLVYKPSLQKEVFVTLPAKVKFPPVAPPYRVQWNWTLGSCCNYKCSYCPEWPKSQGEKPLLLDIKMWKDIWDRIFEKYWCCHIRFSGGEPTVYPGFFDLVKMLLNKHAVNITTNLSFDVKKFAEIIRPEGLSIAASFHPEFSSAEDFLNKIVFLFKHGYSPTVAYVAYPAHLKQMQSVKSLFEKNKIMFKIIPFNGEFQGKIYPQSYDPQERLLLEGLALDSTNSFLNDLNSRWFDFSVKKGKEFDGKKGKLCRMGQMYAKIHPDGRVTRCCADDRNGTVGILGHITDPDLHLLDKPEPCQAEHCLCFKSMLVGCEEEKWLPLWESTDHPVYKMEEAKKLAQDDSQVQNTASQIVEKNVMEKAIIGGNQVKTFPGVGLTEVIRPEPVQPPDYPRRAQPNRVFLVWDISLRCNYNCSYCYTHESSERQEIKVIEINKMRQISSDIYKRYSSCHIRFSGGEPFIYPNFIELLAVLSEYHTLEVSTNLSIDVGKIKEKLNPETLMISSSFHPEFANFDEFLKKVLFLKENRFSVSITCVAYPPLLKQVGEFKEKFEKKGLDFVIQPFSGSFNGIKYPGTYSQEEMNLLKNYVDKSSSKDINSSIFNHKTKLSVATDGNKQEKICRMGQMYARIDRLGNIFRCCAKESPKIGNIIDRGLELLSGPAYCGINRCPCWKAMVVGQEQSWVGKWDYPKHQKLYISAQEKEPLMLEQPLRIPKVSTPAPQVNFTWDSHYKCNFRCPYCWFYEGWVQGSKRNHYLPVEEWMRHWRRIYNQYGKCHIAITGGEPFLYPNFIPLVKELSQVHSVKVTTNMSGDIETFVKEIDPQKVILDLNFHPLFSSQEPYIKKTLLLKKAGFKAGVCYLAYPPQMKQIDTVRMRFESEGINFALAAFWGEYLGRRYPESYSQQDRDMIRPFLGDIDRITYHLKGESPKGKLCYAGHRYAVIQADGKVIRCGQLADKVIGNFFDEEFSLLDAPEPCEAETCPCNEYINLLDAKG
jgi:molybdenum cofactor biosynthesis enzyme MoaA